MLQEHKRYSKALFTATHKRLKLWVIIIKKSSCCRLWKRRKKKDGWDGGGEKKHAEI